MVDSSALLPSASPAGAPPDELAACDPRLSLLLLSWDLSAQLAWLCEAGVWELPCVGGQSFHALDAEGTQLVEPKGDLRASSALSGARAQQRPLVKEIKPINPASPPDLPALVAGDLEKLFDAARHCARCALSQSRCGVVLGNGVKHSDLMFVGERPALGLDGTPRLFEAEVQALLDKMIQAMGYAPDEIACADVIQCASTESDLPFDAPAACRPFLWTQIALIQPKVIVALGKLAAQTLLQVSTPITRLRGQWQDCAGIRLMPTYHPAYLLRHPDAKRQTWHDLQQVMAALDG